MKRSSMRTIGWVSLLGIAGMAGYELFVRTRLLRWGATAAETRMRLPGDEMIAEPALNSTHAVTIRAAADDIWPWLAQMGQGRGGFYSYDWLENLLFRIDISNADRLLPEYQLLEVGDTVPFEPGGTGMRVALLEPPNVLVLAGGVGDDGAPFRATWAFILHEIDEHATRLVVRLRAAWEANLLATAGAHLLLEPGHFVMERKMLLTIKALAEHQARAMAKGGCREVE